MSGASVQLPVGNSGSEPTEYGAAENRKSWKLPLSSKYLEFFVKKRLTTPKLTLLDWVLVLCSFQPTFFSGFWQKTFGF